MYSIELAPPADPEADRYDTAEDAMATVNRLRAHRIGGFVIRDSDGAVLSVQQLAMIVMEARLRARGMSTAPL